VERRPAEIRIEPLRAERAPEPAPVQPEPEPLLAAEPEPPPFDPDDLDTPAYLRQGRLLN
jgi:hypothetical protein